MEALEKLLKYDKEIWHDFVTEYNYEEFSDELLRRRILNMAVLGVAALPDEKLYQYNRIVSNMTGIYGSGIYFDEKN